MKKIVGMMVVGAGEGDRWLTEVLEQRKKLVDDMVIVGNNTDAKTEKIIKKSGFWFYRDDREWGVNQPRIKNDLLAKVGKLRPDWILPSDADEIYDKNFDRQAAEELMAVNTIGYYFAIINLWNDELHYRHDISFWNIRFFRYAPEYGLTFENKNVHCGLAPPVVYKYGLHAPYLVKHYGLMRSEDRQKKVERYDKYDPKAIHKSRDWYNKLKSLKEGQLFNEDEMHEKVARDVASYNEKPFVIK